jgi:hypothetical protein
MEVAIGLLLCVCAFKTGWLAPGLVLATTLYAGFLGGRLVGMIAAGAAPGITLKLLAFEVVDLLIGVALMAATLRGDQA